MRDLRLRVLVADDHAEWRYIIANQLRLRCDVVGYVKRGDQLLEAAIRLQPDVVILDVSMPGESGFGVLPALRAALPDAIIIMISTHFTPLYRNEAFLRGANACVPKNRILSDLLPAISAVRTRPVSGTQRLA